MSSMGRPLNRAVELIVARMDHTWYIETVFVPVEIEGDEEIGRHAIKKLQDTYDAHGVEVAYIGIYSFRLDDYLDDEAEEESQALLEAYDQPNYPREQVERMEEDYIEHGPWQKDE